MLTAKKFTSRRSILRGFGVSLAFPLLDSPLLPATPSGSPPLVYVCPMHPNVRSDKPGVCSQCGMKLRLGIPDLKEFQLEITTTPSIIHPGEKVRLFFSFKDPTTGLPVRSFEVVHEKLFHLFILSTDLKYFLHDHPVPQPDGSFYFDQVFPKEGMYRLGADVFPSTGSPHLIPQTIFVSPRANDLPLPDDGKLEPDLGVQHGANTDVAVRMIPERAVSGARMLVFFHFNRADGMEKWLESWAHMFIASDDTIDLMHEHPVIADGGTEMQFNLIFPRARTYRVWLQFQRSGVLNTVAVNIPVVTLEQAEGVDPG